MGSSHQGRQVLRALRKARSQHSELAELLSLYHDLYEVQLQALDRAPEAEVRDGRAMRWRLEGGIPQLTFDQLRLEAEELAFLVDDIVDTLILHDHPTLRAVKPASDPSQLMSLAQAIFERWDSLTVPPAEGEAAGEGEGALAVGLALAPFLWQAAETILPYLDLSLWRWVHCPVCGGRPNLAWLTDDGDDYQLICARCMAGWPYPRHVCPSCGSRAFQVQPDAQGIHKLYLCAECRHYIKAVDVRATRREVYPLVEHLLTVGLDLAAQQEGLGS